MSIKIGSDPELFLFKDDQPISAHDYVPGTKEKPHPLKHGAIQLDGIALEINVDAAETAEEFEYNTQMVLSQALSFVPKGHHLRAVPSVQFDGAYFMTVPERFKELGCNPDFDGWSRKINPSPNVEKYPNLRTGSGHLHFGYTSDADVKDSDYFNECCSFVQLIDPIWSQWSQVWDTDVTRANLYGGPGAFRPKPYGIEYRRPSNAWLRHPKMYPWIFSLCEAMYEDAIHGEALTLERAPKFNNDWLTTQVDLSN